MKKIFLCALLITTQWMSAQNKTNAQGQKEGKWSGYYESNHLRYIGEFKDGKEVGVFTFYEDTPEQVIKATQDFSKEPGKSFATFYFEGKKMSEGWFAGKQKEGRWIYFHKGGEKINSEEFYKDGKLEGIRKVYYLWKDDSSNDTQLGVIAQDVQKLYPELVSVNSDTGYLSLSYDKLSVVALAAVDELHKTLNEVKEENKRLRELVKQLETKLMN